MLAKRAVGGRLAGWEAPPAAACAATRAEVSAAGYRATSSIRPVKAFVPPIARSLPTRK